LASEDGGWRFGYLFADFVGQAGGLQFSVFVEAGVHCAHVAFGDLLAASIGLVAEDTVLKINGTIFDVFDCQMDIDGIAKANWGGKLALSSDSGPADEFIAAEANEVNASRLEEIALCGFHVLEEVGEVYESGHVSFGKLDVPGGCVFAGHNWL
jgi:hypothetical protein